MYLLKARSAFYCLVAVCVITQYTYGLQPLPHSFDELVIVLVPAESQESFRHYYQKKIDALKATSLSAKKKQLAQLKKTAFNALEVHHSAWAIEVAPALNGFLDEGSDDQRRYTNFLIQYGIYLEFVRHTATQKGSMWSKAMIKKDAVKNRVSSWIGTRNEKKA